MRPPRRATTLAWSLWVLWVLLAGLAVWLGWGLPGAADSQIAVALVGYAVVGALVAARRPRNAVGWLLLAIALTITLGAFFDAYVVPLSNPGYVAVAWVSGWLFNVWLVLIVALLPLVFPDGRLLSPRWRLVWWFDVVAMVLGVLVVAFRPGELAVPVSIQNPLAVHGTALTVLEAVDRLTVTALVVTVLLTAVCIVLRFRRSTGVERQQLKWFAFAGLLTLGGLMVSAVGELLPTRWGEPVGAVGWTIFLATCILGIPVATGIAILRHRLYDIDLFINRTLVYGALTAALAATYIGSILVLRLVLSPLTGQSNLAVAGSTLAVAAIFRPVRSGIQATVDRRFYRHRYDATRTLAEFSSRLRHELDLDAVGADLSSAVRETVQPSHISLWLRS